MQSDRSHALRARRKPVAAAVAAPESPPKHALDHRRPDWRQALPVLEGRGVWLRGLRVADASDLLVHLTAEVTRFIAPPPPSLESFALSIQRALAQQAAGGMACFAVVPAGHDRAVGLVQVRRLEPSFATAEWGFAIGSAYWGTGLFMEGARVVLDFVFDTLGVRRLEARAVTADGRGNGALRKLGAACEACLRRSFLRDGTYHDQHLWAILDSDWRDRRSRGGCTPPVH